MNTTSLLLALPVLLPTSRAGRGDPPRYEVVDLGGSAWGAAMAMDVNERRAVTGLLDTGPDWFSPRHAVLWMPDGTLVDLTPSENYDSARGMSINNAGVVVGEVGTRDAAPEGGFRWKDGVLEILPSRFQQRAAHVDERGYVLGKAHTARFHFAPTLWAPDLGYAHLPSLGGADGIAEDRNAWGDVVGYSELDPLELQHHAFLLRDRQMVDLGTLPGHADSAAFAVNVHGQVVGTSGPVFAERAVLWERSGAIVDLGGLGSSALARDVNDHGEIVGWAWRPGGQVAALWIDGKIHDLNDLLEPGSPWRLLSAESINERGDIVGLASLHGNGGRAFLAVRADGGHLAVIGPTSGARGRTTIEIVGARPGAALALCLGLRTGRTPIPTCGGAAVEIERPHVRFAVADSAGNARIDVPIAPFVLGKHLLMQAVEIGTCRQSALAAGIVE
jgi:probable HAF family extracellular repeat protein